MDDRLDAEKLGSAGRKTLLPRVEENKVRESVIPATALASAPLSAVTAVSAAATTTTRRGAAAPKRESLYRGYTESFHSAPGTAE